jgi:hypothetical protein
MKLTFEELHDALLEANRQMVHYLKIMKEDFIEEAGWNEADYDLEVSRLNAQAQEVIERSMHKPPPVTKKV